MRKRTCVGASAIVLVLTCGGVVGTAQATHDLAFWRGIVRERYAPPAGAPVPALAAELVDMLASADPERRDEIGYSTLANWIYQRKILDGEALRSLTDRLLGNLKQGIGEHDTDSVFRRSFSALTLAAIVARDNADGILDAAEWHRIEQAALAYLAAEQDVRGYDFDKGWMHSAAHTADLLRFLGRSRHLDGAGQARLLGAVGQKLVTAPVVFTHGEDERFARALLSLVNRKDFDQTAFTGWIASTKPALAPRPTVAQLRAIQNWKNVLSKLEVVVSNDLQPSEAVTAARTTLRAVLKELY